MSSCLHKRHSSPIHTKAIFTRLRRQISLTTYRWSGLVKIQQLKRRLILRGSKRRTRAPASPRLILQISLSKRASSIRTKSRSLRVLREATFQRVRWHRQVAAVAGELAGGPHPLVLSLTAICPELKWRAQTAPVPLSRPTLTEPSTGLPVQGPLWLRAALMSLRGKPLVESCEHLRGRAWLRLLQLLCRHSRIEESQKVLPRHKSCGL